MKKVLVLGGSGGIGGACAKVFSEDSRFQITSVHRKPHLGSATTSAPILGDLCSADFRRELVQRVSPQVVIAAFGQFPSNEDKMIDTIGELFLSVVELYEAFEAKGGLEHFVVISSLSSQYTALPVAYMDSSNYKYICAKRLLSDFFRQVQLHMKSNSKIVLVEPGFVRTGFANIEARIQAQTSDDILTRLKIDPIDPMTVARSIFRSVTDDSYPSSGLTLFNK